MVPRTSGPADRIPVMDAEGFDARAEQKVAVDGGATAVLGRPHGRRPEDGEADRARRGAGRRRAQEVGRRVVLFAVAMYVFVLAIQLMKVGARPVAAH